MRDKVGNAEVIIALGFAFAEENVRVLELSPQSRKYIFSSGFGMDPDDRSSVENRVGFVNWGGISDSCVDCLKKWNLLTTMGDGGPFRFQSPDYLTMMRFRRNTELDPPADDNATAASCDSGHA